MKLNQWFTEVANGVSHAAGHAAAFIVCCVVVAAWAASGPLFGFSDTCSDLSLSPSLRK